MEEGQLRPTTTRTKYLVLLGVTHKKRQLVEDLFRNKYEALQIVSCSSRHYIDFPSEDHATKALESLNGTLDPYGISEGRPLKIQYARLEQPDKKEPEDSVLLSKEVEVPGLIIVDEYLTSAEEKEILTHLDQQAWDTTSVNRRTQHYGAAALDFRARSIDKEQSLIIPPIPDLCLKVLQKAVREFVPQENDDLSAFQLTVNEYEAGQGISPHIDVHSLFRDGFYIISLGSGETIGGGPCSRMAIDCCVMDFRCAESGRKKSMWLKPRSLLLLGGEARYCWSHGIPSRKTDKVQGRVLPRGRRVSLSFRSINPQALCTCNYPNQCDSKEATGKR